jgi:hypothetical protein
MTAVTMTDNAKTSDRREAGEREGDDFITNNRSEGNVGRDSDGVSHGRGACGLRFPSTDSTYRPLEQHFNRQFRDRIDPRLARLKPSILRAAAHAQSEITAADPASPRHASTPSGQRIR